jgi:hydroxymethylglutaryl-CoA lyase
MNLPKKVAVVEVGPRDGLQNEKTMVSTADKIKLIKGLASAGLKNIEVTSFTHPKWIPQLADADDLFRQLGSLEGVMVSALVPNERGFLRALQAEVREICLFVSASAAHNQKNVNMTPEESIRGFEKIMEGSKKHGIRVRATISTSFACPFEGAVNPAATLEIARRLVDIGADEIVIADTIGYASPLQVHHLFSALAREFKGVTFAAHFHDTRGMGLANVLAALQAGVAKFDSCIGGLGGCPYAPGASGNIATEDLVNLLHCMGIETGIAMEELLQVAGMLKDILQKPVTSHMVQSSRGACF